KATDAELIEYQKHPNEWYVRHARRILQERFTRAGSVRDRSEREAHRKVRIAAGTIAEHASDPRQRLHGLWVFNTTGGLNQTTASHGLNDPDEHIRAWTARFILEDADETRNWLDVIAQMAEKDPSPVVRRAIAGGLARADGDLLDRWRVLRKLAAHPE